MATGSGPVIDLDSPGGHVSSADGTPIAWFRERGGEGAADGGAIELLVEGRAALVLIHGTTADHTTFRRFGPALARSRPVVSIDRRGRGDSGDTLPYAIEREFEDVAAVADAIAVATGRPVDVLGHSYGGRCTMGAALLTGSIRRIVAYEGAVTPAVGERDPELLARLDRLLGDERSEELLEVFLLDAVELRQDEWEAFRASPTFPLRIAAAHTVIRELRAGAADGSALERYAAVAQPILQVLGSESPTFFQAGARALDRRLANGRIVTIDGARHAAHHTHVPALVGAVEAFLDEPLG